MYFNFVTVAALFGCAFASRSFRIVGGEDADRNEFPYQASMQWGLIGIWQHICGASILNKKWVVTAGHCITETPAIGSFRIKVGILLLSKDVNTTQTHYVKRSIVNPDYGGGINSSDIALLKLNSSISWSKAVDVIALPVVDFVATGDAILSGWGSTSNTTVPNMPDRLQKAVLPIISLKECADALKALIGTSGTLSDTNICTGPLTGGLSACNGDSGGPLAQDGVLIGVVSWGIYPCGMKRAPSVYTQVSNFIPWIIDTVLN